MILKESSYGAGLDMHEPLIFEQGNTGRIGVDLPDTKLDTIRLGKCKIRNTIGLPDLSEPQVIRHYTRISRNNYSIDTGFYPLGSCSMKHNPRLNEKIARLPGLKDIHPFQPISSVQGALELIYNLQEWLKELTGMPFVSICPAAGAHGELCGLLSIKASLNNKGLERSIVLIPESAHGTNPASASFCGYTTDKIEEDSFGRINLVSLENKLDENVAAVMVTNPNTCGVFEKDILEISKRVHEAGAYLYCDGANFNALVGKIKPADLGIDAMHINLHKTFSTPHGGGGPGAGPTVLSEELAQYAPIPHVIFTKNKYDIIENINSSRNSLGRMRAFHCQMGTFIRALTFCLSHGKDGLKKVSEISVLNANYVKSRISKSIKPSYKLNCMHECLFDDSFLRGSGITTLDFAKALIDEGFHPPTMYFPLVVKGAMLIEPTESENKETLDLFCNSFIRLVDQIKSGNKDIFLNAPQYSPWKRLDEAKAARNLNLRWNKTT
ncbi:MAG: putative glycine dehydrogenase (decarboxylating) subunit 2 [Alphaproteobacteria bacterium MarineAlpha9_Bin1]|nr:MAG: putative glycine dehydrogenase (decarboxylating) subunit 2 [Alphaproteobacteria bacterium MarineAlpha9_Bin1]